MKRVLANLNLIAIALIVVGFALLQSLGRALAGGGLLLLGVAAFAAYLVLNRERLKSKNSRLNFIFASNIVVLVVLTLAIVGVVNYLGTKVHKRFDFTEGKIHSIAEQSISVAKNLKKQLNIIAFYSDQNSALYRFRSLMEIYRYYTNKINVEVVDPYKNPSKVKRYEIKSDGTLIFEYDKKDTRIEETSEEAITNAMIKVTRQEEKTIYFTQGHGEPDVDKSDDTGYSEVKGNLEKLSYKVKKLILFQEAAVPENAAALVVAGPQKPLLEKEVYLLEQYLTQKQGRLLLLLNPKQGQELKPLLAKMGLALEDNVVVEVDPVTRLMGGDYFMPVVAKYPEHAITKNFNYATLFPMARGLAKTSPLPKDVSVDFLASTSPNSWGETNYDNEIKTKKITKDPADKAGPAGYRRRRGGARHCGPEGPPGGGGHLRFCQQQVLLLPGQRQLLWQHHRLAGRRGRPDRHHAQDRQPQGPATDSERQPPDLLLHPDHPAAAGVHHRHRHLALPEETMSWKKIYILLAVFIGLVVVITLVNNRQKQAQAKEGKLLDIKTDAISKFIIHKSTQRLTFVKEGGVWQLSEPVQAKADKIAVENVLDDFCGLRYDKLVETDARDLKTYGLAQPEIELRLYEQDMSKPSCTIQLGMKNELDSSSYTKLSSSNQVVLIASYKRNYLEKDLFDFRDKKFFEFDTTQVSGLTFSSENKTFAFAKKDDQWFMEAPLYSAVQESKISDILSKASQLEAKAFKEKPSEEKLKAYSLDKPLLAITFKLKDKQKQLRVAKKEDKFYATTPDFPEICEIDKELVDKFGKEPGDYRERKVAVFNTFDVKEIEFKGSAWACAFKKNKEGQWELVKPASKQKPDEEKISKLLSDPGKPRSQRFHRQAARYNKIRDNDHPEGGRFSETRTVQDRQLSAERTPKRHGHGQKPLPALPVQGEQGNPGQASQKARRPAQAGGAG